MVNAKITLGRVGLGVARLQAGDDVAEVVAREVADQGAQVLVGIRVQHARQLRAVRLRAPARRPSRISPPGRRIMLWYSPFGISSMRRRSVSPPSSANAALQPAAVLEGDDVPAVAGEHRRELARSGCPAPRGRGSAG